MVAGTLLQNRTRRFLPNEWYRHCHYFAHTMEDALDSWPGSTSPAYVAIMWCELCALCIRLVSLVRMQYMLLC